MRAGFSQMNRRERLLLTLLVAVVLPLGIWFLGIAPLVQARERALEARITAAETLDWVRQQDARWRALGADDVGGPQAVDPVGLAGLETALTEAGLRAQVVTLENTGSGEIALGFEAVTFGALGPVLERIETGLGYKIATLRLTRGDQPGQVDARIGLAARAP